MSARAPLVDASGQGAGKTSAVPSDVLGPGYRERHCQVLKPGHRESRCEVLRPVGRVRKAGEGASRPPRRGVRVAGGTPEIEAAWARTFGEDVEFPGVDFENVASKVAALIKAPGVARGEADGLPEPSLEGFNRADDVGFNAVPLQAWEMTAGQWKKYGDTPNLLRDLEEVGATFVRQPKLVDLTWPGGVEVPVIASPADVSDLKAVYDAAGVRANLVELFWTEITRSDRRRPPLKYVFTWLSVLGILDLADPLGEFQSDTVVPLRWSPAHTGVPIGWWDGNSYTINEVFAAQTGSYVSLDDSVDFMGHPNNAAEFECPDYPYWAAAIQNNPNNVVDPDLFPFQAAEVWRRVATALCVTSRSAWHTHMSSTTAGTLPFTPDSPFDADDGSFRDMGLREDQHLDTWHRTTAAIARPRPAYPAYERMAHELAAWHGTTRIWRGRLVQRPPDPGNLYQTTNATDEELFLGDPPNMVVALEFHLSYPGFTPPLPFAYVVFMDPAVRYDAKKGLPSVSVQVVNRGHGLVREYPTVPDATPVVLAGNASTFPVEGTPFSGLGGWNTGWPGPASGLRTGSVLVTVGEPPILLLAEGQLVLSW